MLHSLYMLKVAKRILIEAAASQSGVNLLFPKANKNLESKHTVEILITEAIGGN